MVVVQILMNNYQCPWSISREIEKILEMSRGIVQFKHCYQEANKFADVLSNEGCAHTGSVLCVHDRVADLPVLVRREYRLDKLVFPSFRRCKIKCNFS